MTVSPDENKIGIALGKQLIKDHVMVTEIVVYKRNRDNVFELEKMRDFEDTDACITFQFSKTNNSNLLFFSREEVYSFNYLDESSERETVYKFENQLSDTPRFGVFSKDQRKCIVTSSQDVLFVNLDTGEEVDFDEREKISSI